MQTVKNFSDAELITALKTGANIDNAVGFIYRSYYRMLENYVLTNSGNEMDAEDIIQEVLVVFIDIVQTQRYRNEASVRSFLYTLTRNLWISELRKRTSDSKRDGLFEENREKEEEDVSNLLIYKEAQVLIAELFERMGEKCKQILTLFYYENLSMKEILTQTSYENEQVLRNRKYKCLKELTDIIQQSPTISNSVKSALQRSK
ncbi:RNA polymerase sigma factor [Spirosoma luteum]|uniref:RNA polymerase sigma factor n=1 Tax=Spirosoma luteum TaxID=431553 RepID=UPI000478189A|nr:sigma-70 family RNA polymerase sigma factor [Spirosoma luteum]